MGNGGGGWNKGVSSMIPFQEARVVARKLKLRSEKEWREWTKSGLRSPGMPFKRMTRNKMVGVTLLVIDIFSLVQ